MGGLFGSGVSLNDIAAPMTGGTSELLPGGRADLFSAPSMGGAPSSSGAKGAIDAATQKQLDLINANGGTDFSKSPSYQALLKLLGAPEGGGLNPGLQKQYDTGSALLNTQGSKAASLALSGAEGRGLGDSSISAQGVENANFNTEMGKSSLLSSLYSMQNQNTGQLAADLASGNQTALHDLLGIYAAQGSDTANLMMYNEGLQAAMAQADAANKAALKGAEIGAVGSIIGGGMKAFAAGGE